LIKRIFNMRTIYLTLVASLLTSCLSAPREREARCLAATMTDLWEAEQQLTAIEDAWRRAQSLPAQRSALSMSAQNGADRTPLHIVAMQAALRRGDPSHLSFQTDEERTLYGSMAAARSRHADASKWLGVVARRIQTRIEEDDMLYPVLGMLVTSTAIILYPLLRWNVRSLLWDGVDPDAADDPVQRFCAARLGEPIRQP
jgi:hypothetical protein